MLVSIQFHKILAVYTCSDLGRNLVVVGLTGDGVLDFLLHGNDMNGPCFRDMCATHFLSTNGSHPHKKNI